MNLPPKPDLQTGEPRPPSAPLQIGNLTPGTRREAGRNKLPQPPEGEGPLLEWFCPDRRGRLLSGLFLSALGFVLYVLSFGGLYWATEDPWLWLVLLPWPFVFLAFGAFHASAGADWLNHNKSFIKIYDLVSVKLAFGGNATPILDAKDSHGNAIYAQISNLQQNHELWDLVYNGILHSVHVGKAETNKRAWEHLLLDFPPHLANTR